MLELINQIPQIPLWVLVVTFLLSTYLHAYFMSVFKHDSLLSDFVMCFSLLLVLTITYKALQLL